MPLSTLDRSLTNHDPQVAPRGEPASVSRRCLVAGAMLFTLGNLLHPLTHSTEAYAYPTWELAHLVLLAALPFLVLGLPFLRDTLAQPGRERAATVSVVLLLLGWLGIASTSVVEAFIAPEVGHAIMERLEAGGFGVMVGLFGTMFLAGTLLLGWLVHRSRLGVHGEGYALIASGAALVIPVTLSITEKPAAGAVIIASTVVYGTALASLGRRPSQPG